MKIADLYSNPIGNVKKLALKFFDKERYVLHYENLQVSLRVELKLLKIHLLLEFNQSQLQKQFSTIKRTEAEKTVKRMKKWCAG